MIQAINRRSLITAMAALPATASPGRARSAPPVTGTSPGPSRALQSPAERILQHWRAMHDAFRELAPDVEIYNLYGAHDATGKTADWLTIDGSRWTVADSPVRMTGRTEFASRTFRGFFDRDRWVRLDDSEL